MSKHTPGPWRVESGNLVSAGFQDGDGWGSMIVGKMMSDEETFVALKINGRINRDEERANANLIAAAPEMLYALKRAAINLTELLEPSGELADSATLALIHSVIDKAEGRT